MDGMAEAARYPTQNPFCGWGWISPVIACKGSARIMQ